MAPDKPPESVSCLYDAPGFQTQVIMKKIQQFVTSINCGSCIRTVTPFLDDVAGVTIWRVNVEDARKILTVEGTASQEDIVHMVEEAGFDISPLVEE